MNTFLLLLLVVHFTKADPAVAAVINLCFLALCCLIAISYASDCIAHGVTKKHKKQAETDALARRLREERAQTHSWQAIAYHSGRLDITQECSRCGIEKRVPLGKCGHSFWYGDQQLNGPFECPGIK